MQAYAAEPHGLAFLVTETLRSDGHSPSRGQMATQDRKLLARAASVEEQSRWLACKLGVQSNGISDNVPISGTL